MNFGAIWRCSALLPLACPPLHFVMAGWISWLLVLLASWMALLCWLWWLLLLPLLLVLWLLPQLLKAVVHRLVVLVLLMVWWWVLSSMCHCDFVCSSVVGWFSAGGYGWCVKGMVWINIFMSPTTKPYFLYQGNINTLPGSSLQLIWHLHNQMGRAAWSSCYKEERVELQRGPSGLSAIPFGCASVPIYF